MSMQNGVSTSTVKTAHGAHGVPGHGKNPAAAPGGFASVLSSLGAEDESLDAISQDATGLMIDKAVDAGADTDVEADLLAAEGVDPLGADAAQAELADGLDGQKAEDEDPAQAAAAAAAALAALGIDLTGGAATQGGAAGDSASTLAALAAAGGVAGIAGRQGASGDAAAAGPAGGGGRAAAALADKAGAKDTATNALDLAGVLSSGKQSGGQGVDLLGVQRQVAQRNQSAARADSVKADAVRGKGEDAAARLGWRSEAATQAVTQAAGVANGQLQTALVQGDSVFGNPGERGEDKFRTTVHEFAALGAVTASTGGTSVDAPVLPVAPDSGLTTEMQVAEQVTYWVGRGARDAEISVEGLTENPIHISIALQGQEARVAFRAEQEETRQVLQDSVPHLKELLEREGLALADVSVGSSNPGWSGGSEASAQAREQAANRVRLGSLQQREDVGPVAQGAARATPLPAGRSLDLFV